MQRSGWLRNAAFMRQRRILSCVSGETQPKTTQLKRRSAALLFTRYVQRRQALGLLFPFGIQLSQPLLNGHQLPIDLQRATGPFVGLRFLQLRNEFGLAGFELLDLLFELMNDLLLRLARARAALALLSFETFLVFLGGGKGAFHCVPDFLASSWDAVQRVLTKSR